jgi:hypothetical protein
VLGRSRGVKPRDVRIGGWNGFVFDKPVKVTPGEAYVLNVYNLDFTSGPKPKLKKGLQGNHTWYVNSGPGDVGDYPNGSFSRYSFEDLAFKVYARPGALPGK